MARELLQALKSGHAKPFVVSKRIEFNRNALETPRGLRCVIFLVFYNARFHRTH